MTRRARLSRRGRATGWDSVAPFYRWQLRLEQPALAEAVRLAAPQRADSVLDLGTGTGALLRQLARSGNRPGRAVGVDSSGEMLSRVGVLPEGWTLVRADARRLPFDDSSFQLVTVGYLIHLASADDRRTMLSEAARVLTPAGRLVVITPAEPSSRLGRAAFAPLGWSARRATGVLAGFRPLDPRAALEQAGFHLLGVQRVERGYRSWCVLAEPRA